jgi:hypothetical protein
LDCGGGERNRMLRDSHDWYTTSEKGLSLAQSSTRLLVSIRSSLSLNEIYIAMPREASEGRIWWISTCPEFQITSSLFLGWLKGQIPCSSTKWMINENGCSHVCPKSNSYFVTERSFYLSSGERCCSSRTTSDFMSSRIGAQFNQGALRSSESGLFGSSRQDA